jgi:hypothetical protein
MATTKSNKAMDTSTVAAPAAATTIESKTDKAEPATPHTRETKTFVFPDGARYSKRMQNGGPLPIPNHFLILNCSFYDLLSGR